MGKIFSGILGGVSGSVGPIVGAIVRGVPTIRNKPKKSTKPAVESQLDQRSKFGLATKFITSLNYVVNVGYRSYSKKMSASNAAVKELLRNAFTGSYPNYKIDFPRVTLSKGPLPQSATIKMAVAPDNEILITWDTAEWGTVEGPLHAEDLLYFIFHDEQLGHSVIIPGVSKRSSGTYTATIPYRYSNHIMHVWAFFFNYDTKEVSNNQYMGTITPTR